MSQQQPPRSTYKAFLWDYDSLLSYSDEECCYSLSEREIQILLAQIDPIAWKTRYKPTDTPIDVDLITRWQGNLARKLMGGCCPDDDAIYRYTEDGVLEKSTDGGVTWTPAPEDDVRLTAPLFPPLPGEDGNDKKCLAANNAVAQIKAQADQMSADAGAWGGITLLIAAFLGILAFLSVLGSGGLLTPLIVGLMGTLISAGQAAFIAAMTTEVYETLCCILYCHVNDDGSYDAAAIEAIAFDIDDQLDGLAAKFLKDTVRILGVKGLTNASATQGSDFDFDCSVCECDETWCYEFDFTAEDGDWDVLYGSWSSGIGWSGTAAGSGVSIVIYKAGLPEFNLTHIEVDIEAAGTANIAVILDDVTGIAVANDAPTGSYDWDGDYTAGKITLNPSSGSSQGANVVMTRVLFSGTGANPFGADNCI